MHRACCSLLTPARMSQEDWKPLTVKMELDPVLWGGFGKGSGHPEVRGTPWRWDLTAAFPARSKEAQKGVLEALGEALVQG